MDGFRHRDGRLLVYLLRRGRCTDFVVSGSSGHAINDSARSYRCGAVGNVMSSPLGWRITSDKSGFFIENEYGEDLTPGWRAVTWAGAQVKLTNMAREAFDNLDGRDPPGWEGGFADNH